MIRFWYENDAIQIDGALPALPVPPRSLKAVVDGDRVHVLTLSDFRLSQPVYTEYAKKDGTGFTSAAQVKAYLDAEFAKAPVAVWADITGKPNLYPPAAHTHLWADITDKPSAFPPSSHTHPWSEVTGKPTTYPPSAHTHLWAEITDKPTTFPPSAHTHTGLLTPVGTATVGETTVLALALGVKRYSVAMPGLAVGDRVLAMLTGSPGSSSLQDVFVSAANTLNVGLLNPALGIGATIAVPIAVYKVT